MFRTGVKVAVAAVLAAGALTACQPVKMGAAAIVGDDRITTASLDQTVQDWGKEFKASPEANQLRQGQGAGQRPGERLQLDSVSESEMRGALNLLVTLQVSDEVGKEQHIAVTPAQIEQMITALGGERRVAALTLASGLPVKYMRDLVRFQIVQDTLLKRYGADANGQSPQTLQAKNKVGEIFVATAARLKVKVNPRYGVYDPRQIAIEPVKYSLSAAETGTGDQKSPEQQQPQAPEQQQQAPEQQQQPEPGT